jgi:cyclophilin family peptidyl-prolyl cis-trans isomerase
MSYRQRNQNRRARRENLNAPSSTSISDLDLPGPLRILANRKLFFALAGVAGFAMVASLLLSALGYGGTTTDGPMQGNEAPDAPIGTTAEAGDDVTPAATVEPQVKRYEAPPAMVIDPSQDYTATITTPKGEIVLELYPEAAPQTVNTFVFLAADGYYDGTPFMELVKADDGSKFYAQAGDPTGTGLGTPGFSIPKEVTDQEFDRGAVGMGGSANNSNGGQFFISLGDFDALDGKYTIFGQVTDGLDVLDSLNLLDLTSDGPRDGGDTILSVEIEPEPQLEPTATPVPATTPQVSPTP